MALKGRKFQVVQRAKKVEFQFLHDLYTADSSPLKIDLIAGVYRTEEGEPWVFPVIRKIEQKMAKDENSHHEYLPFLGDTTFRTAACKLILGEDSKAIQEKRVFGVQSLSGGGSLKIGAEFLNKYLKFNTCYIAQQTWDNHEPCFLTSGFKRVCRYRYWNSETKSINMDDLLEDLSNAPENSVVVFQPCANNPTATDWTKDQWRQIANVMEERDLFPFFDAPYVGFATGDMDEDAWPIRYFVERGFELMVAQSFAKIMGLYGERVGNLTIVTSDPRDVDNLTTSMQLLVRPIYCSPPKHGAMIANQLMTVQENFEEWKKCVKIMAERMKTLRIALRTSLEKISTPGSWEFMTSQAGMFAYLGLTDAEVTNLRENHHIYVMRGGRINLCALKKTTVDRVAEAIKDSIVTCSQKHVNGYNS